MRQFCLAFALVASKAQDGPYKVQKTAKVGGDGGFDYVSADVDGRRLYVGRSGNPGRVTDDSEVMLLVVPLVSGERQQSHTSTCGTIAPELLISQLDVRSALD